jgi:AbrB family looped-hinge helix DNA binding protein
MEILGVSKVHNKGKVTLPKEVRKKLEVEDGDLVYFYVDERGRIVVEKSRPSFV